MKLREHSQEQAGAATRVLAGRTVIVVSGGQSSEREISLRSGTEMLRALNEHAHGQSSVGLASIQTVEIELDGSWLCDSRRLGAEEALRSFPSDAVFLLGLHGGDGENGAIQAVFERAGRAYTGSGVEASALCMDKHRANAIVAAQGVRIAPGLLVSADAWARQQNELLTRIEALSTTGWFVKPNGGGSSVATTAVENASELTTAIEAALATGDQALVESRILGVECSCGVMGNRGDELLALPPIEIRPHAGRFFDYEEKYSEGGALELCPPESFGEEVCTRVRELSTRAHAATGCEGYSRVDFIVPDGGEPVFLEINTLPGFTARSLFPQEAKVLGIEFPELLHEILALAVRRFERGH